MFRASATLRASVIALSAFALLATAGTASAKRKKKSKGPTPACDLKYQPFVTGTTWTYVYAVPPGASDRPGIKADVPENFTITVKSVEPKSGSTSITLEESYREISRTTVLSCDSKEGLLVPIDSFYYAGELPGALGITIVNPTVTGEMYPGKSGLKKGLSAYVEVKAELTRAAGGDAKVTHPSAKLEMERQITVGANEEVEVEHGYYSARAVEVALSGRLALDPTPDKSVPLRDGKAMLWFVDNIGLVRAYNRMEQGWELATMTNAAGEPIEF